MQQKAYLPLVALAGIVLAGCPKSNQTFEAGKKAEAIQDYDTALVDYERALRTDPINAEYKLRAARMRSMDSQFHLKQGQKFLDQGQLEMALAEFEKAAGVDPSNIAAQQELQRARDLLEQKRSENEPKQATPAQPQFLAEPPQLKPLSREPINLTMTNNSTVVFETVAKLAGLSVIFDPDFHPQRISVSLPNVTLEQALEAVSMASKSFWQVLTPSVIFVAPDNPQNRREYGDEIVKTFYLNNTLQPQDLTEIVTGLRSMLNIQKIVQMNSENAIVMRASPDEVAAAQKIIDSIDRARPEVLIDVQVLTANRDRLRDLGILPGQSVAVQFNPRTGLQPSNSTSSSSGSSSNSSGSSTTNPLQVTLNNLHSLGTADWSATLPGATANAILTDDQTRIIQDPQIRITDGERAKLEIGEKVPIATGSFQAGVGVAATGVNPLVNTQFTYQAVGVTIDLQPRVHPDNEVSMKLTVDISSLAGSSNIGGINQPIIADNKIDEGEVRLKEGEASVLGGLITQTQTVNVNGIPGLAQIPLMKYLFSDNSNHLQDEEVLILLTPHVVRFAPITAEDLRSLDTGSDQNVRVYREEAQALAQPDGNQSSTMSPLRTDGATPPSNPAPNPTAAQLQFDPANVAMKQGDTATIGLKIANVNDLFSVPLLIHYNPAVIQISDIRDGGFLSGGNQAIPIVQHIDPQRGEAVVSATRQPNTPGVSGTGTLLGLSVKAVGPGTSTIQILEVNARNSQQKTIPLVSGEVTIQVQ